MQGFGTSITRSLAAARRATKTTAHSIRQLTGSRVRWIALAILAIPPFATPAATQSGSEAVVCVGSERRTLATNPIRRVYTEDMEIVYRIGADIGQRDQVERDLSSDLGSYPEVWCRWSDPGDDHAVIISYTGVIRQDLAVDPEDPRFQAFSVGLGTDFDAAEMQATTTNQRFSSQSDGSGYEVLLRETWGVAQGVVPGGSEPELDLPEGRICAEVYSPESCWMELADRPGCYLWNPAPEENVTVTWTDECSNGLAQGSGQIDWYQDGELMETNQTRLQDGQVDGPIVVRRLGGRAYVSEGSFLNGERIGTWTTQFDDGGRGEGLYVNGERSGTWTVFFARGGWGIGPYVNDELHGTWTYYDENGNETRRQRFENGRRVGGFETDLEVGAVAALTPPHRTCQPFGRTCSRHAAQQRHRASVRRTVSGTRPRSGAAVPGSASPEPSIEF